MDATNDERRRRICPVERAGSLDNVLRRWLQDPDRILKPYLREGMTVLDVGCGPGFFTIPMARMVGGTGKVIAADLQDGMLRKVGRKIAGTELEDRVTLHRCVADRLGVAGPVDFVLLFYVVHEVPAPGAFFREIAGLLGPTGRVLMVEPPFHVSGAAFAASLAEARAADLAASRGPRMFPNRSALLTLSACGTGGSES
jgi:ubiquinone/menaquinone biosynthesis C-methylase UbiE